MSYALVSDHLGNTTGFNSVFHYLPCSGEPQTGHSSIDVVPQELNQEEGMSLGLLATVVLTLLYITNICLSS